MDLNWFRDLEALARTGSFSQAAAATHISQSAFSRRIQALERWVGVRLVDRSSHPIRLTDAGDQMLEAGGQAVDRIETERRQILEAREQPDRYVVTFAAQHSIGWRFFPAWLQGFESSFGPIISRLRADNLPDCVTDLQRGEVDFVIAYASGQNDPVAARPGLEALEIGSDQLIPVAKPNSNGNPFYNLEGVGQRPVPYLRFGPHAPIGEYVEAVLKAHGAVGRLKPVYENSMAGALRIRARDGLGIAWLPRSLVAPDLEAGALITAGESRWWIDLTVNLYRRQDERNSLLLRIWQFLRGRRHAPLLPMQQGARTPEPQLRN
ncbi:MAG: LysR family transcriptional regulator [Pseudomonadota bacterium]